jgi:hypothetical protein
MHIFFQGGCKIELQMFVPPVHNQYITFVIDSHKLILFTFMSNLNTKHCGV